MSEQQHVTPIVRFSVGRRVTLGMIVLGVLVLGWISLERLPLEFLPSFSSSNITVSAPYRSSSPEEVERLIVRPLEESLSTINGIDTLSSSATASQARIRISFVEGMDMDMAAVDVRDRIERARHLLPDDLERLSIRRFQTSDIPVMRFDLSAAWPQERLFDFAETIVQRRLERLEGVAQVDVDGIRTPELQIDVDPGRMRAHGVDIRQLSSLMRTSNINVSGGEVKEGSRKLLVRSVGEFENVEEIRRLPLNARGLELGDVADVRYSFPRQESFNYLNGVEALTIRVNKASNSNLLDVVERVKAEIKEMEKLPEAKGSAFRIYSDASQDVRKGLGQLRDAGLIGGALAVGAVFFFLRRFRTTSLVGFAIPISVVATFVLMYFLREAGVVDITLNVVSLAGLMLALGMLVDNSVVVIESIFRHRNEMNKDARQAALHGASEVALPIIASTVTTMCVFLPMIFLGSGGRFSLYFSNIGITICIVMVASLLVALTVVPMAAALILAGQTSRPAPFIERITRWYGRALGATLRHRFLFVLTIVGLLGGSVYLFTTIERSFSVRPLEREVVIKVDTPRQYSLAQTRELYEEVYALLDARREELDISDISHNFDRGTGRSRASWRRNRQFNVYLKDEDESDLTTAEVRDRIREILPTRAGIELRIATAEGRHGSAGVEVQLMGDDPVVLELLAGQVADRLAQSPMVKDVDTSLESGDEEIHVQVQRERALQAGLSSQAVASTVNNALSSRAVSHFRTGDREVDLVMQLREEDRETLDQLQTLPVFGSQTALPLAALAEFETVPGPRSISRENHQSQVTVTANTVGGSSSFAALRTASEVLNRTPLPAGYSWSFGRWNRHQQQDQDRALFALLFALPLVYMVLAALFEDFAQPFTIMFSVPFAALGVGVVMKLAGQPWDNMTMLGMIVLAGVVVNNAIVLIDHINLLRKQGFSRTDAIVKGGQHRLRPIIITAVTTILGMLPLIAPFLAPQWFGPLEGRAANWAPIGLVIVGGLTTSTFLTLMIIPTVYSLIDDLTGWIRRVAKTAAVVLFAAVLAGCAGGSEGDKGGPPGRGGGRGGGMSWGGDTGGAAAAVPVEVASARRRPISTYIETNGTLEAEYEVDVVARVAAPIVELLVEEGASVEKNQILARLDDLEFRAQLEISRVTLNETRLAYQRAVELQKEELISIEEYEQTVAAYDSAKAQFEANEIQIGYTEIRAPFAGLIVERYIDYAENVGVNTAMFRISDFTPLLCPIQVPERDLPKLRAGQDAYLTVESWPGERFEATVLRISPVVEASTGTVKVTLEVDARNRLRPGMFARVFVETETRDDALVIPKTALSLESIGDTVYVVDGETAVRREVSLGFREGDFVEVTSGVEDRDLVVVVGQDGLSPGTPIRVLRQDGDPIDAPAVESAVANGDPAGPPEGDRPQWQRSGGRPDLSKMTPEQLERAKEFMRARGMTDEQIEERIKRSRERAAEGEPSSP